MVLLRSTKLLSFYFNWPEILSRAARAQASSFSPPGAPLTPRAPTVSSPILMTIAPCNSRMCGTLRRNQERGGRLLTCDVAPGCLFEDASGSRASSSTLTRRHPSDQNFAFEDL